MIVDIRFRFRFSVSLFGSFSVFVLVFVNKYDFRFRFDFGFEILFGLDFVFDVDFRFRFRFPLAMVAAAVAVRGTRRQPRVLHVRRIKAAFSFASFFSPNDTTARPLPTPYGGGWLGHGTFGGCYFPLLTLVHFVFGLRVFLLFFLAHWL